MPDAGEISAYFETLVPSFMKEDYDNVGLLVGSRGAEIERALVALDITDGVIAEAREIGAGLIIAHHPLFFELRRVVYSEPAGKRVAALISGGIAAICLHTNLDSVTGGVSDCLLASLGARCEGILEPHGTGPDGREYGVGRYGTLTRETTLAEFLRHTKSALNANGLRYIDAGRPVRKIACCGGTGGNWLEAAAALGCDTYVTSDVKYHCFQAAMELGVNLIDGDHFCTENVVTAHLARLLAAGFPEIEVVISKSHGQLVKFF